MKYLDIFLKCKTRLITRDSLYPKKKKKARVWQTEESQKNRESERARADHQITNDQHTQKREKYKTVYWIVSSNSVGCQIHYKTEVAEVIVAIVVEEV